MVNWNIMLPQMGHRPMAESTQSDREIEDTLLDFVKHSSPQSLLLGAIEDEQTLDTIYAGCLVHNVDFHEMV